MNNTRLAKKLLIKDGSEVLLLNAPKDFVPDLPPDSKIIKSGKADVTLLFAANSAEVEKYHTAALEAAGDKGILWMVYPKGTSKLTTDISRDKGWDSLHAAGYTGIAIVSLDETWSALRFRKEELVKTKTASENAAIEQYINTALKQVILPEDFGNALKKNKKAMDNYNKLSYSHKREYVVWILEAKREETRQKRITQAVEELAGA